jgi:hypothetical protein
MFQFLFFVFVISVIYGGSVYLGPATPRQYMAVVMFICCFFNMGIIKKYWNYYLSLFVVFLFFHLISSLAEDAGDVFLRNMISKYLVALVAYFSAHIYVEKYKSLDSLLIVVLCFGFINAFITILQFIGNPVGIAIGAFFVDMEDEKLYWMFQHMASGDSGQTLFGIHGDPVFNGYFSLILPLFMFHFIYDKQKVYSWITKSCLWLFYFFFMLSLFIIQERSPFLIALLFSMICVWYHSENKIRLGLYCMFALLFILPFVFSSDIFLESRFYGGEELDDDPRVEIFQDSSTFLFNHLLLGGVQTGIDQIGIMPHNILFNSFLYGGLLGGIIVLFVIYKQLLFSTFFIIRSCIYGVPLSFLGYTLNGLTHNPSIITGDVMLWILWAFILRSSIGDIHFSCDSLDEEKQITID